MAASTARHETRALLRAHLAAASGYRHLTRHCPICHRLLRLALEPVTPPGAPYGTQGAHNTPAEPEDRQNSTQAAGAGGDAAPRETGQATADGREGRDEGPPAS